MIEFAEIEPDDTHAGENFAAEHGVSAYVINFVEMFRRLVGADPAAARAEFQDWPKDDPIFARLRIWAAGLEAISAPEDFAAAVLDAPDAAFWPFHGERDLLLALSRRWNQLSDDTKAAIEARILAGPQRKTRRSKKDQIESTAHWQLSRLNWLASQGAILRLDLARTTAQLRKKAPDWKPEYAANAADDHDGRVGSVRVDTSWNSFVSASLADLIADAEKPEERDIGSFTRRMPFAGLSKDKPVRAISALSWATRQEKYPTGLWEMFLGSDARRMDNARLRGLIGGRLAQLPGAEFGRVILTASRWFELAGSDVLARSPMLFGRIWEKFLAVIREVAEAGELALVRTEASIDWTTESINSPAGNLAQLLFKDPAIADLPDGRGFPAVWLARADQLLELPGDSRRYAIVIFGFYLGWMYAANTAWVESRLLSVIEADNEAADSEALWDGFMWGARTPAASLYARLKPHLLAMARNRTTRRRRHGEILSGILLAGWGSEDNAGNRFVTTEELHEVLVHADGDFLSHTLWQLDRWSEGSAPDWSGKLLEFLRNVWPKQKGIRTPQISARLCEIALSQKETFPEVAREVTQLVSRIEDDHVFISELRTPEDTYAFRYPREMLDLLYAILPANPFRWPYGTQAALKVLEQADSKLLNDPKFIELKSRFVEP